MNFYIVKHMQRCLDKFLTETKNGHTFGCEWDKRRKANSLSPLLIFTDT